MDTYSRMSGYVQSTEAMEKYRLLYGNEEGVLTRQLSRYKRIVKMHRELYGDSDALYLLSAPGRAEIAGNHTDHQKGRVLAAAVNLDMICVASPRQDMLVRLKSDGYPMLEFSLDQLDPVEAERGTTTALIRGVAEGIQKNGRSIGGFDAVVSSDVLSGSGLSSSAAFKVLMCAIFDALFGSFSLDPVVRAQISQYAENHHFGKPSGLMDQMAASVGGLIGIDFKHDPPAIQPMRFGFAEKGYDMIVVNTRGSHDDLTEDYAAIRREMDAVAAFFGEPVLRRVRKDQLLQSIAELRAAVGDRAVLRALHFFAENDRVRRQCENIQNGDLDDFFRLIRESGDSSWRLLQNVHVPGAGQPMSLALALAADLLDGDGACRVHGGGFAGTTLNFVPKSKRQSFIERMESVFGADCCYPLDVRPVGPVLLHVEKD